MYEYYTIFWLHCQVANEKFYTYPKEKIVDFHKKCSVCNRNFIFKIFVCFYLLFLRRMIKYTCKSVEETETKFAHHFPPYHIGSRLEVARSRGGYRLRRLPARKKQPLRTLAGESFSYSVVGNVVVRLPSVSSGLNSVADISALLFRTRLIYVPRRYCSLD